MIRRTLLTALLAAVTFSFATIAEAQTGQDVTVSSTAPPPVVAMAQPMCPNGGQMMPNRWGTPVCMHQVTRHQTNWDLIGSGAGLFGGTWVFEIIFTLISGGIGASQNSVWSNAHGADYINWGVVPILGPWVQMAFVPPQFDAGVYAVLAAEALIQAGGIAMVVLGFIGDDVQRWEPMAGLELRVAPMVGETNGISLQGSF